jgi:hypothetical protein
MTIPLGEETPISIRYTFYLKRQVVVNMSLSPPAETAVTSFTYRPGSENFILVLGEVFII